MDVKVLQDIEKRGHEQVVFFHYPKVGLKAIVAIHSTVLGPALGGCRMRIYDNEEQAIDDALRLSEGMTYKSAIAGLDLGGGKSCIICDPELTEGREKLFEQFGHCLNNLNGRYITAEDMGTSVEDIMTMRKITSFAAGYAIEEGGSGDPSPWTARGVFHAIRAACTRKYGTENLSGKKVSVQGVGHVGLVLVELLKDAGAQITVCDTRKSNLEKAKSRFNVEVVDPDQIYDVDADIFAPCAIGQTVNHNTLQRLSVDIIAGAANNQLTDASVYEVIESKDILYCPDFLINAGGVISVGGERIEGGWKKPWVTEKVNGIFDITLRVLDQAKERNKFPEVVALELAHERIDEVLKNRQTVRA